MAALRTMLADPRARGRIGLVVVGVVLALALYAPFYFVPFRVYQLTSVLIYAVAVLGLGLLIGFNGQISLGHGAFFALGAYTAAVLVTKAGWPHLATLPVALLLTFALGFAIGIPALRLQGLYLALVTLGLAVVTPPLLKRFGSLTGGAMGLTVPQPTAPAWSGLEDDQWLYLLALAVAVVAFTMAWNLVNSAVGRAMVSIRENPIAAATMGVDLPRVKVRTFAWSAMYAGGAGCLFTWLVGYVSPDSFPLPLSISLLSALVVGGVASVVGPLFGAAFIVYVPNVARSINEAAPGIVFGALLILAMYVVPGGITSIGRRLLSRLAPGVPPPAPPAPFAAADAGPAAPDVETASP